MEKGSRVIVLVVGLGVSFAAGAMGMINDNSRFFASSVPGAVSSMQPDAVHTALAGIPICQLPATEQLELLTDRIPLSESAIEVLLRECFVHSVPPVLVLSIIEVESGFNERRISRTRDYGLMQINYINHARMRRVFGADWDPLKAEDNIRAGIFMLAELRTRYETWHKVLLCYNMGESGAIRSGLEDSYYTRLVMSKVPFWADILGE